MALFAPPEGRGRALDVENVILSYGDRFIYHVYGSPGQDNGSGGHMDD